ncbi:hypothetical protein NQ317_018936 [Molorchus minor]|uniref:Mitochondrial import inner membrane translocase subunit Tim21 n=1 Tax=Molorchus minor TaxID=1323400 RepID=A0ABQ9JDE4_9CUCU|nr:hypothetical protein NQ317_018936 [Molorchus minor]
MFPVRIIQPLIGNYRPMLKCRSILYQELYKRRKSTKEGALTSARSEIDTNVKPLGEKVKETTKTASYLGIILLGIGVTGTLFYAVFNELFSKQEIQDKLGVPISAYGEENSRRRRRHVSHVIYMGKDDRRHLRMKFYLKGSFHTGTVNLDMVENDVGDFDYRYLFVDVDDMLKNTIVLEDNRNTVMKSSNQLDFASADFKF